ncbi:hypothetical protein AcW1_008446 [Taiwanofungus camphoratus]|nr:hypothetical protein AcW1_008446 [Antrodia cinnamomea]KAI0951396.1 hypothetical protein AcW1_008446 [Antrodia cinnamomea]
MPLWASDFRYTQQHQILDSQIHSCSCMILCKRFGARSTQPERTPIQVLFTHKHAFRQRQLPSSVILGRGERFSCVSTRKINNRPPFLPIVS